MKKLINILLFAATVYCNFSCGRSQSQSKKLITKVTVKQVVASDSLKTQEIPSRLKDIVSRIAAINEVQSAHVGAAGVESENFKNFLELKKVATTQELLQLTDNKNDAVACYSAMALADKSYRDLRAIFKKFLSNNRQVRTFSGCLKSQDYISSEVYHDYWNNVDDKAKSYDQTLMQLDSTILFTKNVYWLLATRALENRVYKEPFKTQITVLAFEYGNNDAIYYLCNWHKAEYADKLKVALLKYLKKTNFSNTGTTDYYETIQQLFSFKDPEVNKDIVAKMKKDRHWEMEKDRFKFILEDNYIYDIDNE